MDERVWRTKDGREMKLSEMDVNHIENCINKILRLQKEGKSWRVSWLPTLYEEYDRKKTALEESGKSKEFGVSEFITWLDAHNQESTHHIISYHPVGGEELSFLEMTCTCGWHRNFDLQLGLAAVKRIIEHHITELPKGQSLKEWAKNNSCSQCAGNGWWVDTSKPGIFRRVICECPMGRKIKGNL